MFNHIPRTQYLISLILVAFFTLVGWAQETEAQKYLVSVERIYDRAPHSAFTDLIDFNGKLYCVFREGSGHVPGKEGTNGTIRILVSDDLQNWKSLVLLAEPHIDLRDPKLSVTPDGKLMLLMGGSSYEGDKLIATRTRVSFSNRVGTRFGKPQPIAIDDRIRTDRDWLWRVTWHRGTGYGVVYQSGGEEFKAHLVSTRDGISYRLVTTLDISGRPNETTLRILPDGEMIAWVRRERESQNGFIGASRPPYRDWTWKEQPVRLGGPNFIALPNGKLIGVTRAYAADRKTSTYLAWLNADGSMKTILTLPSSGDTSYPGLVLRGDRLLVSYYSSHEGKSAIYLATLNLSALMKEDTKFTNR